MSFVDLSLSWSGPPGLRPEWCKLMLLSDPDGSCTDSHTSEPNHPWQYTVVTDWGCSPGNTCFNTHRLRWVHRWWGSCKQFLNLQLQSYLWSVWLKVSRSSNWSRCEVNLYGNDEEDMCMNYHFDVSVHIICQTVLLCMGYNFHPIIWQSPSAEG